MPPKATDLAGRRFDLAIPFGCAGPTADGSERAPGWNYDAEDQILRIHVASTAWQPGDWSTKDSTTTDPAATDSSTADPAAAVSSTAEHAANGFWIDRPWSSSEDCPSIATQKAGPVAPSKERTLAIARFEPVSTDAPKRVPRSFDAVKRIAPEQLNAQAGFRVRLTGRIENSPGGGPVRCIQPAGSDQRPMCVVAASFEEMRVENIATGDVIAVWSMDGSRPTD